MLKEDLSYAEYTLTRVWGLWAFIVSCIQLHPVPISQNRVFS